MQAEVSTARSGTSMASTFLVDLVATGDSRAAERAQDAAVAAIERVAATCSRFLPEGDLCRLNAESDRFVNVDEWLVEVVAAAVVQYERTGGRFDPRVLADLERLGYRETFSSMPAVIDRSETRSRPAGPWRPRFSAVGPAINLGGTPIDLGGIAKGWAVDRAIDAASERGAQGLVDLGGDGRVSGPDHDGTAWSIGIEDPRGGSTPVATFALEAGAYATSSTRVRQWKVADHPVHHLIDPTTGSPGGEGLLAVTVIAPTTVRAEVDAKVAFLEGMEGIEEFCTRMGSAALWVSERGLVRWTPSMEPFLTWVTA